MNFRNMLLAGGCLIATIHALGCGKEEEPKAGGTTSTGGTSGGGGAGGDAGTSSSAKSSVRIAHLSADAPAMDVCLISANGGKSIGPLFKAQSDTTGIEFTEVSAYIEIAAGEYSIRLVEPNAPDCEKALAGTTDQKGATFREDVFHTAAALGELNPQGTTKNLEIALFEDDLTADAGKAKWRFVQASADADTVDVGVIDDQGDFAPVFSGISFAQTGSSKAGAGYQVGGPLDDATIVVRPAGQDTDLLTVSNVSVDADRIVTMFLVGNASGQPKALGVLVCQDERVGQQPPGQGGVAALTSCQLMP